MVDCVSLLVCVCGYFVVCVVVCLSIYVDVCMHVLYMERMDGMPVILRLSSSVLLFVLFFPLFMSRQPSILVVELTSRRSAATHTC
ncbi:hypothetical protein B0J18DRAFT_428689 [Chaetomium sp. MPI-SDFR-AT-0129]|nr:hypothetical protein B0J18DRAFT_428689 [Chaetomium sp. MPI-SDFR-AT-0129]